MYRPAIQQGKEDALSRRSYMVPCLGEPTFDHQKQILLGPDRLQVMATNAFKMPTDSFLISTIRTHLETVDEFAQDVLNHIIPDRASCSRSVNSRNDYNQFSSHDNLLFRNNLLYVQMAVLDSLFYNTATTCQWPDILEFIKPWN